MLTRDQFVYDLPPERIAQTPAEPRDASRLLRVDRQQQHVSHHIFSDLPTLLRPGDVLVVNNTRVLPCRLVGHKPTGGQVEVLLARRLRTEHDHEVWEALTRPGLKTGQSALVTGPTTTLTITALTDDDLVRTVRVDQSGAALLTALHELGHLPTPPYIRAWVGNEDRYQTIFGTREGSAAAPTAGLHFTERTFADLAVRGITVVPVTLHVGLGTFLPVKTRDVSAHQMHSEWYQIEQSTADTMSAAKRDGRRVVAVGTTVVRTLETLAQQYDPRQLPAACGDTSIFITPPYPFRVVDALVTNFHLPESTLVMLVSAFASYPQTPDVFTSFPTSLLGRAYAEAIAHNYRFFSFGDAMLIE